MKVISVSPARSVNFTARSSSNVHPLPPHPVVMASFHTAVTLSRSEESEISMRSGKSCEMSFVEYFIERKHKAEVRFTPGLTKEDPDRLRHSVVRDPGLPPFVRQTRRVHSSWVMP